MGNAAVGHRAGGRVLLCLVRGSVWRVRWTCGVWRVGRVGCVGRVGHGQGVGCGQPPRCVTRVVRAARMLRYGDVATDGRFRHWNHEVLPHWRERERGTYAHGA